MFSKDFLVFYSVCMMCICYSSATCQNYFYGAPSLDSIRALYLGDNDFEKLPADFGKLKNLQVVSTFIFIDELLNK